MRRRTSTRIASGVTLPVTPMLDMTFQLLFFLVLTLRVSSVEEVKFKLDTAPGESGPKPGTILDDPFGGPAPLFTVVVRALPDGSGGISSLMVQFMEGELVLPDVAMLETWLSMRRPGPGGVRIRADHHLKYARVIDVVDACHRAGFKEIGFAAPGS